MNARVSLQVPPRTFYALASYLHESGSGADIEDLAATAIDEWVVQARVRARTGGSAQGRGYQWKGLFLPSGSRLRMSCDGNSHYAEVQDDDIVFEGRSVSPAQMANTVAGGTRNAWRELWILSPALRNQARQIDSALGASPPAPLAAAVPAAGAAEALLRRLALLLERNLESRQPQYRRRTDTMAAD